MKSAARADRFRIVVTSAVLAAVVAPAVVDRASFPLSTYPIYAHARDRGLTVQVVSVIGSDGVRRPAGLDAIARTDDPLIAQSRIDRAVRDGTADQLCATIARRIGTVGHVVEISTDRYDLVDLLRDDAPPLDRRVVARCEVEP